MLQGLGLVFVFLHIAPPKCLAVSACGGLRHLRGQVVWRREMLPGLRSVVQLATGFALDSYLASWQHGTQWRSAALGLDTVRDVNITSGSPIWRTVSQ